MTASRSSTDRTRQWFLPTQRDVRRSSLRGWYDLGSEGENSWFDLWSDEGRDEDRIYSLGLNPMVEIVTIARAADTPALTHEFGHGLGLEHLPYVETTVGRSMVCNSPSHEQVNGIDGYRLALNGTGGATKSSVYGNAEHASIMRSLMFPCAGTKAEHFIHPDQYAALIERFSEPCPVAQCASRGDQIRGCANSISCGGPIPGRARFHPGRRHRSERNRRQYQSHGGNRVHVGW